MVKKVAEHTNRSYLFGVDEYELHPFAGDNGPGRCYSENL